MVKVLLASAVVLCRQDPEHHLSEERKAGNREVAAVPRGAVPGSWSLQRPHWLLPACHAGSNFKPGAWPRGGANYMFVERAFLQVESTHMMDFELLYKLLGRVHRAFTPNAFSDFTFHFPCGRGAPRRNPLLCHSPTRRSSSM